MIATMDSVWIHNHLRSWMTFPIEAMLEAEAEGVEFLSVGDPGPLAHP